MDQSIYFKLLSEDVEAILRDLSYVDFLRPIGLIFWLYLLFSHLSGIDRRDGIVGYTYGLYLTLCGVVLVIVVPEVFIAKWKLSQNLLFFLFILVLSQARWYWRPRTRSFVKAEAKLSDPKIQGKVGKMDG